MSDSVSLREVLEEFRLLMVGARAFVNRNTGAIVYVSDESVCAPEYDGDVNVRPDSARNIDSQRQRVIGSKDYVELPSGSDLDEREIARRFCSSIDDAEIQAVFLRAVKSPDSVRQIESAVEAHGLRARWRRFREDTIREFVIRWLEENEIPWED